MTLTRGMQRSLLALLVPFSLAAGPWSPGEVRPLPPLEGLHSVAIGPVGESTGIVLGGEGVVASFSPTGAAGTRVEGSVNDVVILDLSGDGVANWVLCGDGGVSVARGERSVVLSEAPCDEVVGLAGDVHASLLIRHEEAVRILSAGDEEVSEQPFEAAGVRSIAAAGGRFAALGEGLVLGPEPEMVAVEPETVAVAPDGSGWARLRGGEQPSVVLADGTEVPLPAVPLWGQRLAVTGPDDLVIGLGERRVAWRLGDAAFDVAELPIPTDHLAAGDLDGDGCTDLVGGSWDGAEVAMVMGVCSAVQVAGAEPEPTEITLGESWAQVSLKVGDSLERQLVDTVGSATRFAQRGGPLGLTITSSGLLRFRPSPSQVGLWRVSVLVGDAESERWSGVVLRVSEGDGTAPEPAPEPKVDPPPEIAEQDVILPPANHVKDPTFFTVRECLVAAGVAGGVSRNEQANWASVGLPPAVPSVSPAVTMSCAGGGQKIRWFAGVDSAPTYFYLSAAGRQNHILAGTLGVQWGPGRFRMGPYVNLGLVVVGTGLRMVWTPITARSGAQHGVEFRATTYLGNLSIQGLMAYTWQFGSF